MSVWVSDDVLSLTVTRPIVNVEWHLNYLETVGDNNPPTSMQLLGRPAYVFPTTVIEFRKGFGDERLRTYSDGELIDGPYYFKVGPTRIADIPVVALIKGKFSEPLQPGDSCFPADGCYVRYEVSNISELSQLIDIKQIEAIRLDLSYDEMDHTRRSTQLILDDVVYFVKASDLDDDRRVLDLIPGDIGPASTAMQVASAITQTSLTAGGPTGLPEIEVGLALNYEESKEVVSHQNEFLASGGWIDILGHLNNLPSGEFLIEIVVNNVVVLKFSFPYINFEHERFAVGDLYELWGFDNPYHSAEIHSSELSVQLLQGRNVPNRWVDIIADAEEISLTFDAIEVSDIFMLLNDVIDDDIAYIEYPSELASTFKLTSIHARNLSWWKVLLLVAEDQGLSLEFEGKTIRLQAGEQE